MLRSLLYRMSAFVPGLGQLLRGRATRGLGFFAVTVLPLAVIGVLYYTHVHDPAITAFGSVETHLRRLDAIRLRYLLASLPSAALWICSILDCLHADQSHTATESRVMGIMQG